ncbi:MAG: S8 family serine peptidase, partial [Promethearchaeia archaeon]
MASLRIRINQLFIGFILLNLVLSSTFIGEFRGTFGDKYSPQKDVSSHEIADSHIDNSSQESIRDIIDAELLHDVERENKSKELNLLFEVNNNYLNESMDFFGRYGKIEDILDYQYYCGFSAKVNVTQFKSYITREPEHIEHIEYNGKAELTLKNTLQQLRVNPYLREKYGLRGDNQSSIAILDSGVDANHSAFKNKNITWVDFTEEGAPEPKDTRGHGTGVGGVACGEPYRTVDEQNRTIVSERYFYPWSDLNISKDWKFSSNSFLVNTDGTIKLEGNWFAESDSKANVYSFDLVNSKGKTVKNVSTSKKGKSYNLTYQVNETNYGIYSVQHHFNFSSEDSQAYGLNLTLYIPENQSTIEQYYQGIAPDCNLVALRCFNETGRLDDIIEAMNWVLDHKENYSITTAVMSFKTNKESKTVRNLADQMVKEGIFVAAAAGNDGPFVTDQSDPNYGELKNWAGSLENAPGCADKAMSVGATTYNFSLTEYSSRGGPSPTGNVIKPDIVAPGGSKYDNVYYNNPSMYVPDTNFGEYLGETEDVPSQYLDMDDFIGNDTYAVSGTSYAAPIVGGAAQLIIERLGGIKNWNYTEQNALFIKNLLLLTATETYPNERLDFSSILDYSAQSPELNRGGKDIQEGYGKINIDAAIDALNGTLEVNSTSSGELYSIPSNQVKKPYCWARTINLPRAYYNISLEIPENADFDLYIYDYQGDQFGEPIIKGRNINETVGGDEALIDFPAHTAGKYFIVVKGVNGSGQFNLSIYTSPTYYDTVNPACQLNLPLENGLYNESIFIEGNASDNYNLSRVSIIISSPSRTTTIPLSFGNTTASYFNATWISKKIDNGECIIYAKVYDEFNNTAISESVNITIFND